MPTLLYLIISTVDLIIRALQLCMFIRAIFSLFFMDDSPLLGFLNMLTEPVIFPVRKICAKFGLGDGLPIDIPFFITFLLLSIISALL